MDITLYAKGILVGLAIAAPIGPINLIIVTRTLNDGRRIGWVSGAGAAVADAFYGGIAAFGLTLISDFLLGHQVWFRILGGLALILLGARVAFKKAAEPAADDAGAARFAHTSAFGSLFLLNLMSPMTILTWMAVIAGMGMTGLSVGGAQGPLMIILGVFSGSVIWITFLVLVAHWLLNKLHERWLFWLNVVAGLALAGFGVVALITGVA